MSPPQALIPPLFKTRESLTCPVNRHTSPVLATLSLAHAHTRTHGHTKAQTNLSEIFNRASQLALPLPSFIILHLLVCLPACSLSSSVVSSVFPSFLFFCSSVQLFQLSLHPPVTRTYRVQLFADYFTFLLPFPAASSGPSLLLSTLCWFSLPLLLSHSGPIFLLARLPCLHFSFFLFSVPCLSPQQLLQAVHLLGENPLSSSILPPSVLPLHLFQKLPPSLPLSPLHMPQPYIH